MSRICAVGTAVPPHSIRQAEAQSFARALFAETFADIDRLMPVFENALVDERHFAAPLAWFQADHTFPEKNRLYVESALEIGRAAVLECLERAGLEPGDVDHFFLVSTTGVATPSLEARLINELRLRRDVRRTPIFGLGCAGGAAGLARAYEFTRAFPDRRALLLAVELCGLTFQRNDRSKSNLIATSLFGDGAAAVVVCGADTALPGLEILGSRSMLWYDSLDVMGWEVNEDGLKVVFARDIPSIVRKCVVPLLLDFLREHGLERDDLSHVVLHPGGAKVLQAYEEGLGLEPCDTRRSRDVLRRFGNMSSPTVLFVLDAFLRERAIAPGEYGIVNALGPGFSSEMLLVRA